MNHSTPKPGLAAALDLGSALGQSHAFGLVAGRCSAAQASCLHRIRTTRVYLHQSSCWRDFCSRQLGIDGRNADKIVHLWEDFGATYFELAQLTLISPDTYRALAPSISDGALHLNGEVIQLVPENSPRLAAAIAGFRRTIPAAQPRQLEPHERLAALNERCDSIVAELRQFSKKERCGENWLQFTQVLSHLSAALHRLRLENGLL
jgi:hypothetical protein